MASNSQLYKYDFARKPPQLYKYGFARKSGADDNETCVIRLNIRAKARIAADKNWLTKFIDAIKVRI
jgi:hypothetical protein